LPDPRLERADAERREAGDGGRDRECEPAAAGEKSTQQREGAQPEIFRDEALRRRGKAEVDQRASSTWIT